MNIEPLRIGLFLLLVANAIGFFFRTEYNDAFDSMAWIVLMGLYELENRPDQGQSSARFKVKGIRNLAIAVVVIAELSYFVEGAWLDGLYSGLWLLVAGLFEVEARHQTWVARHLRSFRLMGILLLLGMMFVILTWLNQGAYFNAYDGLLWSLAFLVIDLDLVEAARRSSQHQGDWHKIAKQSTHP